MRIAVTQQQTQQIITMDKGHLTLQDVVIGDFLQEWLEIPERWSMPMYVDGIFADGDLYLNFDGNEADPWEAKIKNVFDIPFDWAILSHFGFVEEENHLFQIEVGEWQLAVQVFKVCNTFLANAMLANKHRAVLLGEVCSIRMLQHKFYDETKEPLKLVYE